MKRLRPVTTSPAGGFSYTQEETGHKISNRTFAGLLAEVIAHRKANNLPVPFNIDDIVESHVCSEHPHYCKETDVKVPRRLQQVTLELAVRFTKTLFYAAGERVGQGMAESRAEVCSTCEDNVDPIGCSGCTRGIIKKVISFVTGSKTTSKDSQLKSCRHCGCFNAAQIWMPIDALQKLISEEENEALPPHCWKKKL